MVRTEDGHMIMISYNIAKYVLYIAMQPHIHICIPSSYNG